MPEAWAESKDGDAFVVTFDGVDREGRDAGTTAVEPELADARAMCEGYRGSR